MTNRVELHVIVEPSRFGVRYGDDERLEIMLNVSPADTLADVIAMVIPRRPHPDLAMMRSVSFVAPSTGSEVAVGEVMIVAPDGRLRLTADPARLNFDELMRAHTNGLLAGDPQRIVIRPEPPAAEVGGAAWDAFVDALELFWHVAE